MTRKKPSRNEFPLTNIGTIATLGTMLLIIVIRDCYRDARGGKHCAMIPCQRRRNNVGLIQFLSILSSLLAAVGVGISACALIVTSDQLTRTFPPRIVVTGLAIWPTGSHKDQLPAFVVGEKLSAEVWIVNTGREKATIKDRVCRWYWRTGPLPMVRPLTNFDKKYVCGRWRHIESIQGVMRPAETLPETGDITMRPGDVYSWRFDIPPKDSEADDLYILGYIIYQDRLFTRLATQFARKYDPSEGRFEAIKHYPQYEGYE